MKTRLFVMALSATVGIAGGLLAVQNQQPNQPQPDVEIEADDVEIQRDQQQQQQLQRDNLQETSRRQQRQIVHRASALIGMEVQNQAGKDLGDINDLAITDDGKIEYAAVSFGGFAGIGDKLFAVPWDALQIKQVDPQGDDWVAVLQKSVTEQELENAQGFDKDNWPNMADPKWKAQNDRTFRTTERPERDLQQQQTTPRR